MSFFVFQTAFNLFHTAAIMGQDRAPFHEGHCIAGEVALWELWMRMSCAEVRVPRMVARSFLGRSRNQKGV